MSIAIRLFVLICASLILARTLCVLDHMSHKTRWWVQWIYALECAGASVMGWEALLGEAYAGGALILLAGVAAAHLYDGRIYPPRLMRIVRRGRRREDIERSNA